MKKLKYTILRSSGIGTFIGILPAEGSTVAAIIGYNEARRWSKDKDKFGKGSPEGIVGPEAANNAAAGGAMVPTLALRNTWKWFNCSYISCINYAWF